MAATPRSRSMSRLNAALPAPVSRSGAGDVKPSPRLERSRQRRCRLQIRFAPLSPWPDSRCRDAACAVRPCLGASALALFRAAFSSDLVGTCAIGWSCRELDEVENEAHVVKREPVEPSQNSARCARETSSTEGARARGAALRPAVATVTPVRYSYLRAQSFCGQRPCFWWRLKNDHASSAKSMSWLVFLESRFMKRRRSSAT
jgi:hypothetical protein